jgi:hypothetical protein
MTEPQLTLLICTQRTTHALETPLAEYLLI